MLYVTMARGDIHLIRFQVTDEDTGDISQVDFTEIYFSVKRNALERNVLFQKTLSTGGIAKIGTGDYQIRIEPEDTENLEFNRKYDFDIQIEFEDQIKQTKCGELYLEKEITCSWNEVG